MSNTTKIENDLVGYLKKVLSKCTATETTKPGDVLLIKVGGSPIRLSRKEVSRRANHIRLMMRCLTDNPFGKPTSHDRITRLLLDPYATYVAFAVGKLLGWWEITHTLDQHGLKHEAQRQRMMAFGCGKIGITGFS